MIRTRPMWYGIVDGELRWMAALELKEEKFEDFADLMRPGSFPAHAPFQILCLFTRNQNQLNNRGLNVSVSLFDQIRELQADLLFLRSEISGSDVKPTQVIGYVTGETTNVPFNV